MAAFDGLPAPLRRWLSEAALPWSTSSVQRIWARSQAKGMSAEETLRSLSQAEARTLARDRLSSASVVSGASPARTGVAADDLGA